MAMWHQIHKFDKCIILNYTLLIIIITIVIIKVQGSIIEIDGS